MTYININTDQRLAHSHSSHQTGIERTRLLLSCLVSRIREGLELWVFQNAEVRQPWSLRQHLRQRNGLFRRHANIAKVDALQVPHLRYVSPQQRDGPVILSAKIPIVT